MSLKESTAEMEWQLKVAAAELKTAMHYANIHPNANYAEFFLEEYVKYLNNAIEFIFK